MCCRADATGHDVRRWPAATLVCHPALAIGTRCDSQGVTASRQDGRQVAIRPPSGIEVPTMTIVDCPLCRSAVALPDDVDALECPFCAVVIELAAAAEPTGLPAAA
jgi:hypothetical protein